MDKSQISSPIQNQHLYRVVEVFSYPKLKPEMVLWIPNGNAQCPKVQVKVEAKVVEDPECSTILSTEIGSAVLMKRILMRMLLSMMDRFCLQLHFHQWMKKVHQRKRKINIWLNICEKIAKLSILFLSPIWQKILNKKYWKNM